MAARIAFLITPAHAHNDNHLRLPRLFQQAGWQTDVLPHDAMNWRRGEVYCGDHPARRYELIWPIGLGPRSTYLDRQEILCRLAPHHCINAPEAYLSRHGKSAWLAYAPPTYIARDAQTLTAAMSDEAERWVLKPLAGSFGHQVHVVSRPEEVTAIVSADPSHYWMLQAFIASIEKGETRTLLCADKIIGSYLRIPTDGWRANLVADGTAECTVLSDADAALVEAVSHDLRQAGIRFAAIDSAGGYVVEVNIANPGGLGTLSDLHGEAPIQTNMLAAIDQLRR